ncbi:MAG: DUF5107 domain-containing protein [Selenomonadaceae bacterium]|nr:DUF5107 domain-containing protein [Selenomonadaceae bacterium]
MKQEEVRIWEEEVTLPTYETGKPDKNPMFLEKRVYQGSSGRVYPYPVVDKIEDEKVDKVYHAVYLENQYLKVMVLPELGGRIHRAIDKTNNYDFVYYNHVVKPALVGLAGPWISGGIEFNWPQHHRPNTFGPVEHTIRENADGSKTLFVSEIDRMYGTKGMAAFTLYPDKAYIEITGQLYNRTPEAHTFLWWANPAVPANENTQSIFPPDVHAVFDHGKRDVSKFPIATGTYYKMDYSAGVDVSRFKNIKVPTSYMAQKSDYDFVGGYDHGKKAGILHVADHHVSPGKKQWTWGSGDFGKAWDRNLTDDGTSYIELMTGVFTDNQPDFTWLQPGEEKQFKQYFMPYKDIAQIKNATKDAAVSLDVKEGVAHVGVYATGEYPQAVVLVRTAAGEDLGRAVLDLTPLRASFADVQLPDGTDDSSLRVLVETAAGRVLVHYEDKKPELAPEPDPAKAIPADPAELRTCEALYLAGRHLEQYRHATYEPDAYYLEGLKRDPEDMRLNMAYGELLYRRGLFEQAEPYLRQAVKTSTRHSPNPYDSEPLYYLGLVLACEGRMDEAYDAYFKAAWSASWQAPALFAVAQLDCQRGQYERALEHVDHSLVRNAHNCRARNLRTYILRKLGRCEEAMQAVRETLAIDPLDLGARYESAKALRAMGKETEAGEVQRGWQDLFEGRTQNIRLLSIGYAEAGDVTEALAVLALDPVDEPLTHYYAAYYEDSRDHQDSARREVAAAAKAPSYCCFPNTLMDMRALERAAELAPEDAMVRYYLGCLYYDKRRHEAAITLWEAAARFAPDFPTTHRNLALGYYNVRHEAEKARKALEKAFALGEKDARVFMELDQLYQKIGMEPKERLALFEQHLDVVELRDDLYVTYITLLNLDGQHQKAYDLMMKRHFHPWEGGEGKITKQYVCALEALAKEDLAAGQCEAAAKKLEACLTYPENLGEGKLACAVENDVYYLLGCVYDKMGQTERARAVWKRATEGVSEPASAMYYNDQPPESIYYQGLALRALGREDEALGRFHKLIDYGEKHVFDHVVMDYFAVSLPDFLVFEGDLDAANRIHCHFLMALGHAGLGESAAAKADVQAVLKAEPAHAAARALAATL